MLNWKNWRPRKRNLLTKNRQRHCIFSSRSEISSLRKVINSSFSKLDLLNHYSPSLRYSSPASLFSFFQFLQFNIHTFSKYVLEIQFYLFSTYPYQKIRFLQLFGVSNLTLHLWKIKLHIHSQTKESFASFIKSMYIFSNAFTDILRKRILHSLSRSSSCIIS